MMEFLNGIYYVCDNSSNCAWNSTNWTLTLDATKPAISIVYPANTTYTINVSALNYTSDGVSCWYSINNGATNSSSVTCGANFTDVTSIEGSNTWILYSMILLKSKQHKCNFL